MFTPNLTPRDFHHLWLDEKPRRLEVLKKDEHQQQQQQQHQQQQQPMSAPPLSSYSSMRPGACFANGDDVQQRINERLRQLREIRTLGYEYLTPLGVGKTMQMIHDELEIRRQLEEQLNQDVPTAENLLGEAEQEQQLQRLQQQQQQQQVQGPATGEVPGNPRVEAPQETQDTDLDDGIPEAEDAVYEADYDDDDPEEAGTFDRQYDQGFMVTEQYEEPVMEDSEPTTGGTHFITPTRPVGEEVQPNRGIFHSGSTLMTTLTSESSFDAGNISINGSDLDMTIDD